MAHQRHPSVGEALKTPHAVSLKVLRLSRPTLATQFPLPYARDLGIAPQASLAYPAPGSDDSSILSPVLNLPEAFGSAYVGETFSCTLCANNEVDPTDATRAISGIRIQGEMQTPSTPSGSPLDLSGAAGDEDETVAVRPGGSLQKIVRFELKEEGNHVLAVTVTYTETTMAGEGKASGGRVRTFRKLYQFVAQPLLSVRTKVGKVAGKGGGYLLEAQLENMGESAVTLETVTIAPKPPLTSHSLNWDAHGTTPDSAPVLDPKDVVQVAFVLREGSAAVAEPQSAAADEDGRRVLGQLTIEWRGAMGDGGSLSTGWLSGRR